MEDTPLHRGRQKLSDPIDALIILSKALIGQLHICEVQDKEVRSKFLRATRSITAAQFGNIC